MGNKFFYIVIICLSFLSCNNNEELPKLETLQDYINHNSTLELDEVIACAASKRGDTNTSFVFFYPLPGATEIKYYETSNINDNKNDFSLYKEKKFVKEDVFNGYLGRFVRNVSEETWCIVSYKTQGKFHKSNPIRLKNKSKPTEWTDQVVIDNNKTLEPKFMWNDGVIKENVIYFQVITNDANNLLSGTYTYDKWFQYYNLSNVVLNVTRETPPALVLNNNYNFTLMGVSEDNWVNLVIQKSFLAQ